MVEFAIIAPLLVLLMIAATDYSMAILARQEIHSAARAGTEFAINRGYDTNGIKEAVKRSADRPGGLRFATIPDSGVTIFGPRCACYGNVRSGVGPITNAGALPTCSLTADCAGMDGGSNIAPSPYVEITVTGSYTPLFSAYWLSLNNGNLTISAKYAAKTFFVR